jgi:glycosyltransferase involved in cell wall biosynthesis
MPGIKNALYTATETNLHPSIWVTDDIRRADVLLVPCELNRQAFRPYNPRIEIVHEGIDPALFPYVERSAPGPSSPFRFMYLGDLTELKGVPTLIKAFREWYRDGMMPPNTELYIKCANPGKQKGVDVPAGLRYELGGDDGEFHVAETSGGVLPRITVDNRRVPFEELQELYASAHCFVFPSTGEGWGLPITEAMATGAPCIWTHWGGPEEYADETTGYPLTSRGGYKLKQSPWLTEGSMHAFVEPGGLINKMYRVYSNYDEALARGRRASERIHSGFTWDRTVEKLIGACEKYI